MKQSKGPLWGNRMNVRAGPEKCRGPPHMAIPSCRADYSADNVRSMNGIERASMLAFPIYMEGSENIINPTAKG